MIAVQSLSFLKRTFDVVLFFILPYVLLGISSWGKESAPVGASFFPLGVDPILKGLFCPGKHTGRHMGCFPSLK